FTVAPGATTGRRDDITSPPTSAPAATTARPFTATTLSVTLPVTRTLPLRATTEPFTSPPITTGPSTTTTLPVRSPGRTSMPPVTTTRFLRPSWVLCANARSGVATTARATRTARTGRREVTR